MKSGSKQPTPARRRGVAPGLAIGIAIALIAPLLAVLVLVGMTLTRLGTQPTPTIAALFTAASVAAASTPIPASATPAELAATASPAPSAASASATLTLAAVTAGVETTAPPANATATPAASATANGLAASATPAPTAAGSSATATVPPAGATATVGGPSATPPGTATATPTATATATTPATTLTFVGTRAYFDQTESAYRVVGEILNPTGVYQQMVAVTGSFYDDQNQLLADDADVLDYLPQAIIPPNGRVPFELLVPDLAGAARFDLEADAVESLAPIREFTPTNLSQYAEFDRYCVRGTVQNSGDRLEESLVVVVVLYDGQETVINYGDFAPSSPFSIFGTRVLNFQVCVSPPNDSVARYEVRVLGR